MNLKETMPNLTLEKLAIACHGIYKGAPALMTKEICGVAIDSRLVEEDYLFIPIKGERVDGHDFISQVKEKGACCVLSERELPENMEPYIKVDSTEQSLKEIAEFYRQSLPVKVVGITGSVGKTSTKEMIASVVSRKYRVHKTAGNFNNEIGLPLTVLGIRREHQVAILEMGISDFEEMHRLAKIAKPDMAVITNIGLCHLENLGSRDGVLQAKTELFDYMRADGTVILNGDDDKLATKKEVNGKPVIYYGIHPVGEMTAERGFYATEVKNHGFDGMTAKIHTPKGEFEAEITIPGEHNVYNALAATAVGMELGLTLEEIGDGIRQAKTIAGRTNVIRKKGMQIIDDCYNANPVSMEAALDVLSHGHGRTIAVLGDMGELGEKERELHFGVGKCVAEKGIHTLFCAGCLAEEYKKGVASVTHSGEGCRVYYYADKEAMIKALLAYVQTGDSILIKASHFMDFPKVVDALAEA